MTGFMTIGLYLAKTVIQVHGADGEGRPVLRKRLRRGQVLEFFASIPSCLVGLEACASAHYWARELQALGPDVRLIPPQYVKPFVKTNKTDATDAEAIREALLRPTMRFAAVKSADQQSVLIEVIEDTDDHRLPLLAREALVSLVAQLHAADERVVALEKELMAWHRSGEASQRLVRIPGVGVIMATALVATFGDARQFRSARQFAAWLELVPRQKSSGGSSLIPVGPESNNFVARCDRDHCAHDRASSLSALNSGRRVIAIM